MNIGGFLKTSYSDFPGRLSSVIFMNGCNLNCPYCHNGDLAQGIANAHWQAHDIIELLHSRRQHIRAVVISGGEPTLHADLPELLSILKHEGYEIKLDTNGSHPEMLEQLISDRLVDYIAMDLKWDREDYRPYLKTVELESLSWLDKSIQLVIQSGLPHEFRTTVLAPYHDIDRLRAMLKLVWGAQTWVLQQYQHVPSQLENTVFETYTREAMVRMLDILKLENQSDPRMPTLKVRAKL